MFLLALLAFLPKIVLGFAVAHLIWADKKLSSLLLKFFLGIPLGMGITSTLLFFSKWAALDHAAYITVELTFTTAALAAAWIMRGNAFKKNFFDIDFKLIKQYRLILSVLALSTLISMIGFSTTVVLYPHGREDAWSNWNLVARFIYHSNDLSNALHYIAGSSFPGYPFMVSLDAASGWIFLNSVTTRVPIILAGLFTFSIPAILFFGLTKSKGIQTASIAAVIVMAPWLAQYGTYLMSDIPMAAFYLGSSVALSLFYNEEEPGLATLAGILAGYSSWVKNDGQPFILVTSIVILLISIKKRNITGLLRFALGLAVPLITIFCYREFLAAPGNIVTGSSDMLSKLLDPSRFQTVFVFFLNQTYSFGAPAYAYTLILLAILFLGGVDLKNVSALFTASIFLMQYAAYFLVYLITPLELVWHLNTSMPRVFAQIAPLLVFAVFSLLRDQNLLLFKQPNSATSTPIAD